MELSYKTNNLIPNFLLNKNGRQININTYCKSDNYVLLIDYNGRQEIIK